MITVINFGRCLMPFVICIIRIANSELACDVLNNLQCTNP